MLLSDIDEALIKESEYLRNLDKTDNTNITELNEDAFGQNVKNIHLFFSHFHLDHIMGLPIYKKVWDKNTNLNIYAGTLEPYGGLHKNLNVAFSPPLFPVPFDAWPSKKQIHDFTGGDTLKINKNIEIKTCNLNHPNGAIGYRIIYKDHSVCYITDHEHSNPEINENLFALIKGTDLFIYDSSFNDEEYPQYKGWGHSTWQEALRITEKLRIKKTALFHHEPANTDSIMKKIEQEVNQNFNNAIVSRQNMIFDVMKECLVSPSF